MTVSELVRCGECHFETARNKTHLAQLKHKGEDSFRRICVYCREREEMMIKVQRDFDVYKLAN